MEEQVIANGGVQYVPQIAIQYVYLDFDGELTSYNGEILTVDNVEVKDSSLTEKRITDIVAELNAKYANKNVIFVTERPTVTEYSTIYIGKTDAFSPYGNFAGLAETIDEGNQNKNDKAFVVLDSIDSNKQIVSTIVHETNHLLGKLSHDASKNTLTAFAQSIIGNKQSAIIEKNGTGGGYIVTSGGILANGYRYEVSREGITGNGRYYVSDFIGGTVNGVEVQDGGFLGVLGGVTNNITLTSGAKVGLFSSYYGGIGVWVESSTRGITKFTHLGNRSAVITQMQGDEITGIVTDLNFTGNATITNGTANNTTIRQGGYLYIENGNLSGNTQIIGQVSCIGNISLSGAISIAVSERTYNINNIAYINNLNAITGGDINISLSSENLAKYKSFLIATNANDFHDDFAITVDGESAGQASIISPLVFEGRYYSLEINSSNDLYLYVEDEPLPDLMISEISCFDSDYHTASDFTMGDTINLIFTIKNIGLIAADEFDYQIKLGEDVIKNGSISELDIAEECPVAISLNADYYFDKSLSWDYVKENIKIIVDPEQQLAEANESNNESEQEISISFAKELPDALYEYLARNVAYNLELSQKDIISVKIAGEEYFFVIEEEFHSFNGFDAYGLVQTDMFGNILKNGNIVLACRGTEPSLNELFTDVISDANPAGIGYDQYHLNKDTVNSWLKKHADEDAKFSFTGHSLGGALSQMFAAQSPIKVSKLVTFNSPGMAAAFSDSSADYVHHYVNSGDMVSLAGANFSNGDFTLLRNTYSAGGSIFDALMYIFMEQHCNTQFFSYETGLLNDNICILNTRSSEILENKNFSYLSSKNIFNEEFAKAILNISLGSPSLANLVMVTREGVEGTRATLLPAIVGIATAAMANPFTRKLLSRLLWNIITDKDLREAIISEIDKFVKAPRIETLTLENQFIGDEGHCISIDTNANSIPDYLFNFSELEFIPVYQVAPSKVEFFSSQIGISVQPSQEGWNCVTVGIGEAYYVTRITDSYGNVVSADNWGVSSDGTQVYILSNDMDSEYFISIQRHSNISIETGTVSINNQDISIDTQKIGVSISDIDANQTAGSGNDTIAVKVKNGDNEFNVTLKESELEGHFTGDISLNNNGFTISPDYSVILVYEDKTDSFGKTHVIEQQFNIVSIDAVIDLTTSLSRDYSPYYNNLDWTLFTIMISTDSQYGEYLIVSDALTYNRTIQVFNMVDYSAFELAVGESKVTEYGKYSLIRNGNNLLFKIEESTGIWDSSKDIVPPNAPVISNVEIIDNKETEIKEVVIQVSFAEDAVINEYSTDFTQEYVYENGRLVLKETGSWYEYCDTVKLDDNDIVYFRSKDASGNVSQISSYKATQFTPVLDVDLAGTYSKGNFFTVACENYTIDSVLQLSTDNFKSSIVVNCDSGFVNFAGLNTQTYKWRLVNKNTGSIIEQGMFNGKEDKATVYESVANGAKDVFFAQVSEKWDMGYAAQHNGNLVNNWSGTQEQVTLAGKNKIEDIFIGSKDSNILFLTDDANGDALFLDDIYTHGVTQSRLSGIDKIIAGAGDDVIDFTSSRYAYVGSGMEVYGGNGNDTIWMASGSNTLFGDAGNDRLVGGANNDVIVGGIGNDRMHGGGGDDIFCFGGNFGTDTIEQLADGKVIVWFGDLKSTDVTISYSGKDTILTASTGKITAKNLYLTQDNLCFGASGFEDKFAELSAQGAFSGAASQMAWEAHPDTVAPGTPTVQLFGGFPADKSVRVFLTPVTDNEVVAKYELRYSTSADMKNATVISSETATIDIENLDTTSTYYWQVRAVDGSNNASAWSEVASYGKAKSVIELTSMGDNTIYTDQAKGIGNVVFSDANESTTAEIAIGDLNGVWNIYGTEEAVGIQAYADTAKISLESLSNNWQIASENGAVYGIQSAGKSAEVAIDEISSENMVLHSDGDLCGIEAWAFGSIGGEATIEISDFSGTAGLIGGAGSANIFRTRADGTGDAETHIGTLGGVIVAQTDSLSYGVFTLANGSGDAVIDIDLTKGYLINNADNYAVCVLAESTQGESSVTIGTLSGRFSAVSSDGSAYAVYSWGKDGASVLMEEISGEIVSEGAIEGVGLFATSQTSATIGVNEISGVITAEGRDAFAIYAYSATNNGGIHGVTANSAMTVTGTVLANGTNDAYAITGNMDKYIAVFGSVMAGEFVEFNGSFTQKGNGVAIFDGYQDYAEGSTTEFAMYSAAADDIIVVYTGGQVVGDISLGGGANALYVASGAYIYGDIKGDNLDMQLVVGGAIAQLPMIDVITAGSLLNADTDYTITCAALQTGSYGLIRSQKTALDFTKTKFNISYGEETAELYGDGTEFTFEDNTTISLAMDDNGMLNLNVEKASTPQAMLAYDQYDSALADATAYITSPDLSETLNDLLDKNDKGMLA